MQGFQVHVAEKPNTVLKKEKFWILPYKLL